MRKLFVFALTLAAFMASPNAVSQTTISASSVTDPFLHALPTARLCFAPVDVTGKSTGFRVGSTQVVPAEVCAKVTSGVMESGKTLAPTPTGVYYHIYARASNSGAVIRDYGMTPITGSTWTMDTYDPATMAVLPHAITMGSVTTLAPGSSADCTLSGSGPYYLNCGIPQGTPGVAVNWRGAWVSATAYARGDGFYQGGYGYIVMTPYTSGGSFGSTDTANASQVAAGCAVTGCAFTGAVTLNADPTSALGAATKQYVDARGLGAGTVSGPIYGPFSTLDFFGDSITGSGGYGYNCDTAAHCYAQRVATALGMGTCNSYQAAWDALTDFEVGDVVSYYGSYYVSIAAQNLGHTPIVGANWSASSLPSGKCENHGVSGTGVAEQFDYVYPTVVSATANQLFINMIGTNDVYAYGATAGMETNWQLMDEAMLAFEAIPETSKVRGQGSAVSLTGTWANSPYYGGGTSIVSTTNGSTATVTLAGPTVCIAYTAKDGNGGAFSESIDGTAVSLSASRPSAISNFHTRAYGSFLNCTTGLPATNHTVEIIVTSSTGSGNQVWLDWAWPAVAQPAPAYANGPTVLSVGVPTSPAQTASTIAAYSALAQQTVTTLASYGLNVSFAPVAQALNSTSDWYSDNVHPLDDGCSSHCGHGHIAQAVLFALSYGATANLKALMNGTGTGGSSGGVTVGLTQLATDSFTRADASTLGSNWTDTITGGSASAFKITSNAAVITTTSTAQLSFYNAVTFSADQCASAVIGGSNGYYGPGVRVSAGVNGYAISSNPSYPSTNFQIVKEVAGTVTVLNTYSVSTIAPGQTVKICVAGTTVTGYVQGALIGTVTDTSLSSGQPGIYGYNAGSSLTDWTGFNLIQASDTVGSGVPTGCGSTYAVGSTYRRSDGGAGTTYYVCEGGTTPAWAAK